MTKGYRAIRKEGNSSTKRVFIPVFPTESIQEENDSKGIAIFSSENLLEKFSEYIYC